MICSRHAVWLWLWFDLRCGLAYYFPRQQANLVGHVSRARLRAGRPGEIQFREGIHKLFRIDSLICRAQPEAMDEPLKVSAPHERVFRTALMILLLAMIGLVAVTA